MRASHGPVPVLMTILKERIDEPADGEFAPRSSSNQLRRIVGVVLAI